MHSIICSLVVAVMALFPGSDSGGKSLYQRWMEAYEKHLYQQMYDNFEREKAETVTFEPKNAVSVQNMEVKVEQAAGEEAQEELLGSTAGECVETHTEVPTEASTVERTEEHIQPTQAIAEDMQTSPVYRVDGYIPDEGLQNYLYQRLCEHGIGYFMPYAVCLIAQESTWNPMAENANNEDKGLLQYKIKFVPWMDWRNPYQQIDYFTAQMANRAAAGCTVSEMISRHNTSDYGSYNQSYVDAVMQHSNTLVQIR